MSDDVQVLEALRTGVARLDDASGLSVAGAVGAGRRRRRRRAVGRVALAATAVGALLAGALALGLADSLPLVSSAPPAGRTATLEPPEPTDLDDAAAMRPTVEQVVREAGLERVPGGFTTSYSAASDPPIGAGGVVAGMPVDGSNLRTAHVDGGVDVSATGCDVAVPSRPDLIGCTREVQADGAVLLHLQYEAEAHELVLVHDGGWVVAGGTDEARLRAAVLDPRLRW